ATAKATLIHLFPPLYQMSYFYYSFLILPLPLSLRVSPFSEMVQSDRQDDFDPLYPTLSQKILFLF
ncbi:MAG: hypothetical protein RR688_04780, partial [Carnobacterium sp.]|uniref:hypothetical protein n=1 Tax=Carnobacterium sp. TaxID=48221 RepID=UPI002FC8FCC1